MVKNYIILLVSLITYSSHAMEFVAGLGDVVTDGAIIAAVENNAPDALKKALDARMGNITLSFQVQIDNEAEVHEQQKRTIVQQHACNRALIKQLERGHEQRRQTIAQRYLVAREQFKNVEVPAYLRLAQQVKPATKSDLLAKGSVLLGLSLIGTLYELNTDFSLSTLIVLPLCIAGCYFGTKKLFDGNDYQTYLREQKKANAAVQKLLRERQGNVFEQAIYQLKVALKD